MKNTSPIAPSPDVEPVERDFLVPKRRKSRRPLTRQDLRYIRVLGQAVWQYKWRLCGALISTFLVALLSIGSIAPIKPMLDLIFGTADFSPPIHSKVNLQTKTLQGELGLPGFPSDRIEVIQEGDTIRFRVTGPADIANSSDEFETWMATVYPEAKERWLHSRQEASSRPNFALDTQDRLKMLMRPLYQELLRLSLSNRFFSLGLVALILVLITTAKGIANFFQEYLTNWIGRRVVADIRQQLYDHIMDMRLNFFQREKTGGLLSYLTIDVELFGNSTMAVFGNMLQEPVMIAAIVGMLLFMQPQLTLLYAAVLPILGWIMTSFGRRVRKARRKSQDAIATMSGLLQETFSGIRVVRAFQMEDVQRQKFYQENRSIFRSFVKLNRARALSSPLIETLGSVGVAAILMIGGYVVLGGGMDASTFIVYLILLGSLYQPIKRLNKAYESVQQGMAGADRIFQILERPIELQEKPDARAVSSVERSLEFQNISHRYESGPLVLQNIQFVMPKGKVTALVGPSGSGKSTLASFVPRLIDPTEGTLRLDGVDIRDLKLKELRNLIALVPQEISLFHDTVANNVSGGQENASEERIIEALQSAQAWEFVSELPDGIHTIIGERATLLSGGQAQRIAVARAFYRNAPILILDEATSSLDSRSEELVHQALDRLMKDRTVLAIAHRLSTVIHADRIIVLEHGKVVGIGRHSELLKTCPLYQKLYQLQFDTNGLDSPSPNIER